MRNCPNCGAALEPYKVHCDYCGTYYYDLTAFDCSKKCFVKFKTYINGQECHVTALARPSLEEVEVTSETADVTDPCSGTILHRYITQRTCVLRAKFWCEGNPEFQNSLFTIEAKDETGGANE